MKINVEMTLEQYHQLRSVLNIFSIATREEVSDIKKRMENGGEIGDWSKRLLENVEDAKNISNHLYEEYERFIYGYPVSKGESK